MHSNISCNPSCALPYFPHKSLKIWCNQIYLDNLFLCIHTEGIPSDQIRNIWLFLESEIYSYSNMISIYRVVLFPQLKAAPLSGCFWVVSLQPSYSKCLPFPCRNMCPCTEAAFPPIPSHLFGLNMQRAGISKKTSCQPVSAWVNFQIPNRDKWYSSWLGGGGVGT